MCWIDGRHDINTVLKECGLDRFHGAKVVYDLHQAGLLTVSDSAIEEIGRGRSIAVRGPIDVYNQVFISTLADSNVTEHLRIELIDEREVEIPMVAAAYTPNGVDHDDDMPSASGDEALVFTATVSSPEEIWRRFAEQSSAFIVLANANSTDSLKSSVRDLNFVRKLGDMPIVVGHLRIDGRGLPRAGRPSPRRSACPTRSPSFPAACATATRSRPSSRRPSSSSSTTVEPAGAAAAPAALSERRAGG